MTGTEIDISDLFDNALNVMRMTPGNEPRVSIMDFVMIVTRQNNDRAGETIRNMQKADPDFFRKCNRFQFSGARQKEQFVLCLSECVELLMTLPGKQAKEFRKESVGLLTRLFAGDPTLHDLIIQNGLSDDAMNQFARAEVGSKRSAAITTDEVQLSKRIRIATMMQELHDLEKKGTISQLEIEQTKQNIEQTKQKTAMMQLEHMNELCKQCGEGAPESQKRWMQESNRNYKISVFHTCSGGGQLGIENGGAVYTDDMESVTISTHILLPKGLKDPDNKMAMAIGSIAATMYGDWNEGAKPLKEKIFIRGSAVDVNKYFKKDLVLLEAAFVEWERRTGMVAAQKAEKTRKLQEKEVREAEERLSRQEKATEKAERDLEKKVRQKVNEKERLEKQRLKAMENDAIEEKRRMKRKKKMELERERIEKRLVTESDDQPSMFKYWA
jgi:hypothetical protein